MVWARVLAYITGTVDRELLLRNEYLAAEKHILKAQIKGRLLLYDGERATLAEIAYRLGRKALEEVAPQLDYFLIRGMPISGFAAIVGEGQHPDRVRLHQISDVVREAFNGRLAGWYVRGDTRNTSCRLRPAGDTVERCIDRFEKLDAEPRSSTLIPDDGVFKFGRGIGFDSEWTVH